MLKNMIAVGESVVGRAVFAKRGINAGEKIARIVGDVFAEDEYGSEYCVDLENGTVLEPGDPFRYLNHNCDPNCELIIWESNRGSPQLCLHSLKQVKAGDELTIDYAWDAEAAIPCRCESLACRGWIVEESELGSLLRTIERLSLA